MRNRSCITRSIDGFGPATLSSSAVQQNTHVRPADGSKLSRPMKLILPCKPGHDPLPRTKEHTVSELGPQHRVHGWFPFHGG
jgi:hypothetical protein